jgi:hypothetical protein
MTKKGRSIRVRHIAALAVLAVSTLLVTGSFAAAKSNDETPATLEAVDASDVLVVGAGQRVTPSGNTPSPEPEGSTAARPTPQETYNPIIGRQTARPAVGPESILAPPAAQLSFTGEDIATCCLRPPDTHGAVGLNQFVEVTNGEGVTVFSKGGAKLKQTSFASFFGYTTTSIFDPRVVYDKVWNRWIIHAESFNIDATTQNVFIAASTSSDPSGSYCLYKFDVPEVAGSNDFYDYPQLGMDQDAAIITANIFDSPASGSPYLRSRMFAPPKAALYNCRGFSVPYFNLGAVGTVAPPIVEDGNSNAYLLNWFNSTTLKLFRATNLGRSGASVVLQANITIPAVSAGPPMRQPGSGTLGPPTGRFQNASTQIGDGLLNIHTVATGSFPIPKWYQVDTEGAGANTIPAGRSGFFFESGTSDDSNPSIVGSAVGGTASNPIGRMFVTWTSTDALNSTVSLRHLARVKGSGRLATDATTITGGATFGTASVAYNPTTDNPERWGDYSAVSIDPVAAGACGVGQRAWIVNEQNTTASLWGSRFGRLGFC